MSTSSTAASAAPPTLPPAAPNGSVADLRAALARMDASAPPSAVLDTLVACRLDVLPLPGQGATLQRWQALAAVAEHDLSLAKLYEGHTDALAILAELRARDDDAETAFSREHAAVAEPPRQAGHAAPTTWGVWAAEAPDGRATIAAREGSSVVLTGGKCWCSGAATATHALLTAWPAAADANGAGPQLVRMALRQPGVQVDAAQWQAVGMAGSASLDVRFDQAIGTAVGAAGDYLRRPGFWHGGAGIAACWYGGAVGVAAALRRTLASTAPAGRAPLRLAALGKVDLALAGTAALLREAAAWIDARPQDDAAAVALRVRLAAEATARTVLDEAGRALGAGPYCRDAHFARAAADLPVFIRQSHAERDFAALAERLLTTLPSAVPAGALQPADGWLL